MNVDGFLTHHGLSENPFVAEEARHDGVFERLMGTTPGHPEFEKIMGRPDQPGTAVVFGEKGTGKTAIRLTIEHKVRKYNQQQETGRTLVVGYDDLNPVLDRLVQRRRQEMGFGRSSKATPEKLLEMVRLEDHQDAILSLAVTSVVDAAVEEDLRPDAAVDLGSDRSKKLRSLSRQKRLDLAVLAALYDQPGAGAIAPRWRALRSVLRLGRFPRMLLMRYLAIALTLAAAVTIILGYFSSESRTLLLIGGGTIAAMAAVVWFSWLSRHVRFWSLSRKIYKQTPTIDREPKDLRTMLLQLPKRELAAQPWPLAGTDDARYQLTNKLVAVLEGLGYSGILVLVDRVDEPTLIHGQAERMKSVIWPMFDNKYLQQRAVGFKLLLPIELRDHLYRESSDFFQEARLDKQNLVDRLSWSGATLYDISSNRLRACQKSASATGDSQGDGFSAEKTAATLTDLFDQDVTREMLVDALDQMHQPRDAFKFLYSVIQEHCTSVPDDQANYRIARLTLDAVRRNQAQRVQDLSRGVAPA